MTAFIHDPDLTLWNTDARRLPELMGGCVADAVVTDPPYELGLGTAGPVHQWDSTGIAFDPAFWRSMLPLVKPGGFLFAFGSPRTWHRLACAVEDAGWRLADQLCWLYASGMPKGEWADHAVDRALGHADPRTPRIPGSVSLERGRMYDTRYRPQSPQAEAWSGFNPTLKPAWEPILVAQKPRSLPLGANLLAYGTGALNAGACALDADMRELERRYRLNKHAGGRDATPRGGATYRDSRIPRPDMPRIPGRHPSDLILDPMVAARLPKDTPRFYYCPKAVGADRPTAGRTRLIRPADGTDHVFRDACTAMGVRPDADAYPLSLFDPMPRFAYRDLGVARLAHPTVKPLDLMRWLVRLATPPHGLVLEPFAGSGTTLEACRLEGLRCVGAELDPRYLPLIRARLDRPVTPALV